MLIGKEEADKRLNSNGNLLNRLRSGDLKVSRRDRAMELFGIGRKEEKLTSSFINPFQPQGAIPVPVPSKTSFPESKPQIDPAEIPAEEVDTREKLERIQHEALNTLMLAIKETKDKIKDLHPAKAADVAAKMGKIVDAIRSDKNRAGVKDKQVHLHFYTPEPRKIEEFEVIDV